MRTLLDRLANGDPAPGGGAVAAASGAMGVALQSMALRHTLAKRIDETLRAELSAQLAACEALRTRIADFVDVDGAAVRRLIDAYRLPASDPRRREAIDESMVGAIRSPLDCAAACLEGLRQAHRCVAACHRNVAGDAAAGVIALQSALRICTSNVSVNSHGLRDAALAARLRADASAMLAEGMPLAESALGTVSERLAP
jgi:formiminotetrahydrofolate cyclodeaminase